MSLRIALFVSALALCVASAQAQPALSSADTAIQQRPIPSPVTLPQSVERAVEEGTRTRSGRPGPDYWMNTAHYDLEASLNPTSEIL